jgi:hypothetical protein
MPTSQSDKNSFHGHLTLHNTGPGGLLGRWEEENLGMAKPCVKSPYVNFEGYIIYILNINSLALF